MPQILCSLSTTAFDPDGSRVFAVTPASAHRAFAGARRVAAQATLDGGALIYDTGYAVADRLVQLVAASPSRDLETYFSRLVRHHDSVHVTLPEGPFLAVPEKWSMSGSLPAIDLRLTRQLT